MKKYFVILFVICSSSLAMQQSSISRAVVKEWPKDEAAAMQAQVNIIQENETKENYPLYKSIWKVIDAGGDDLTPVQQEWDRLKQYGDEIPLFEHKFTQRQVLTAAILECMPSAGRNLAIYFAKQPAGVYPYVNMARQQGLVQAVLDPTGGWTDEDCIKFLETCNEVNIPLNVMNPSKDLPLHIASLFRHIPVVEKVFLHKEWALLKDKSEKTPIDYATQNYFYQNQNPNPLVEYLQK